MNKNIAVSNLRPGVEWTMVGNDVANIVWHTEGVEPLTEAEVAVELDRLELVKQQKEDAKVVAKESALTKLTALGLTEEEINAILGSV
jgi:hypothetical protein